MNLTQSLDNEPNMKIIIVTAVVLSIDSVLLILSCFLLYKVYTIYKFNDIPMILSITSITLILVNLIIFNAITIDINLKDESRGGESFFYETYTRFNIYSSIGFFMELFIVFALLLDLYKWVIFIIMTMSLKTERQILKL
jgi:hypothetical protein